MKVHDLSGRRFGRLVVETLSEKRDRRTRWICRCDCGEHSEVVSDNLTSGHTTSCGCAHKEMVATRNRTLLAKHGHVFNGKPSRTYVSWRAMRTRCERPNAIGFNNYGGRGIKVCDRWQTFENFLTDMGERPTGKTLDRYPDKSGNYEPGNCRWATPLEQASNRRDYQVILPPRQSTEFYRQNQRKAAATKAAKSAITAFGQTKTLAEWATGIGMNRKHIWQRLKRGWPPDKAVSVPCGGSYAAL